MAKFVVKKIPTFDIAQTLECGQVFRYGCENGIWHVNSLDHILYVKDNGNEYEMETDDVSYFKNYLDLDRDYESIQKEVQDNGFVSEAIEYGKGVRVLNQDPFEMLFSFIVSQNNNIPRIKGTIEKFCKYLGKDMGGYYAFPTLEALASKDVSFYKDCGCGYRAEYIDGIAKQMLKEGFPDLNSMSTEQAREKLMSYKGIGRKVADCILLFGTPESYTYAKMRGTENGVWTRSGSAPVASLSMSIQVGQGFWYVAKGSSVTKVTWSASAP